MILLSEEFKIVLGADINEADVDAKVKSIKEKINSTLKPSPIKLTLDVKSAQNQINSLKKQIECLGNIRINLLGNSGVSGAGRTNGTKQELNELNSAYKQMLDMQKKISSIKLKLGGLEGTGRNNEISVLRTQLASLETEYAKVSNSINHSQLSTDQWNKIQQVINTTEQKLEQLQAKVVDTQNKTAQGLVGKFDNRVATDIQKLGTELSKVQVQTQSTVDALSHLSNAQNAMNVAKQSGDVDRIAASYREYEAALANARFQIQQNQQAERDAAKVQRESAKAQQEALKAAKEAQALQNSRTSLSSSMDLWLRNNSAAAKDFGAQIRQLQVELQSCDATRLNGIKSEFQEITRQAELAGKATQSFGDRLKSQFAKFGTYLTASTLFSYGIRTMRSMYENVVSVDTAMTQLYRVTNLTAGQYDAMYDNMVKSAKDYGVQLDSLINSTASWVRLGFDTNVAGRLAEITSMYQHVTDLDESVAVENLVTAYKGFQDQLDNAFNDDVTAAVERVADIYDKLGNEFAESAADVGDGLSRSASVLNEAGNSIEESVGMFTGIQEVLQDSSTSGSALKILAMRLRGMKGELQDLGEEVDENVDSISKMQTQILNMTHGKVNIFNDDGSFKSTYQIMKEIAAVYDELTDTDRANLLETIAGKNRANAVAALIKNWSQVEKATIAATNAEGTAAQENKKYLDSLNGRIASMKASWQALANTFLGSDFLKGLISSGTSLLNILDALIGKVGTIPTLLTAIAGYNAFKGVGELIKQFHYLITLRVNTPTKSSNGNMNELVLLSLYRQEGLSKTG